MPWRKGNTPGPQPPRMKADGFVVASERHASYGAPFDADGKDYED